MNYVNNGVEYGENTITRSDLRTRYHFLKPRGIPSPTKHPSQPYPQVSLFTSGLVPPLVAFPLIQLFPEDPGFIFLNIVDVLFSWFIGWKDTFLRFGSNNVMRTVKYIMERWQTYTVLALCLSSWMYVRVSFETIFCQLCPEIFA